MTEPSPSGPPTSTSPGCIAPGEFAEFLEHDKLSSEKLQHLDACERCQALLEGFLVADPRALARQVFRSRGTPRSRWVQPLGGLVILLTFAIAIGGLSMRSRISALEEIVAAEVARAERAEEQLATLRATNAAVVADLSIDPRQSALAKRWTSVPALVRIGVLNGAPAAKYKGELLRLPRQSSGNDDCSSIDVSQLVARLRGENEFVWRLESDDRQALSQAFCASVALGGGEMALTVLPRADGDFVDASWAKAANDKHLAAAAAEDPDRKSEPLIDLQYRRQMPRRQQQSPK